MQQLPKPKDLIWKFVKMNNEENAALKCNCSARAHTVNTYLSNRLDLYSQKSHSLLRPFIRYSQRKFKDRRRTAKEEQKKEVRRLILHTEKTLFWIHSGNLILVPRIVCKDAVTWEFAVVFSHISLPAFQVRSQYSVWPELILALYRKKHQHISFRRSL